MCASGTIGSLQYIYSSVHRNVTCALIPRWTMINLPVETQRSSKMQLADSSSHLGVPDEDVRGASLEDRRKEVLCH
jgi:hypothetical protein